MRALAGISLEIDAAELVTVVGRSACGKTTFLKILAGLCPRTAGRVANAFDQQAVVRQAREDKF